MLYHLSLSFCRPNLNDNPRFHEDANLIAVVEASSPQAAADTIAERLDTMKQNGDEILQGVQAVYLESLLELKQSPDQGCILLANCEEEDDQGEVYKFSTVVASPEEIEAYCLESDDEHELPALISW